ncbi:hypothetical protein HYW32_00240 [Candidatus Berkelbacteria bacterium]|nr:hypothetical protein [Candidatus Berkelbacteria bacterium]
MQEALISQTLAEIPLEMQGKRGWRLEINDESYANPVRSARLINDRMKIQVTYGWDPGGYDTLRWREPGGGGAVTVPYAWYSDQLYLGVVDQPRATLGKAIGEYPQGFLDPGKTHFEAATEEVAEELADLPRLEERIKKLPGGPGNPQPTILEAGGDDEGTHYFALEMLEQELEEREGRLRLRSGLYRAASKGMAEKILGSRFIPWQEALLLKDGRSCLATCRFLGWLASGGKGKLILA